jgi:hypothetical protein
VSTRYSAFALVLLGSLGLSACGGAGPYNFARSYRPLSAEKAHFKSAQAVPYEDVKRDPNGFQTVQIAWFGVVTSLGELPNGRTRLFLELHAHQERHLCSDDTSSSCRLTISERGLGPFSADVLLRPEEKVGPDRLWVGSLVKVYGHATGNYDDDGGPILDVKFHRHFPRGTYVTTSQRAGMRR